MFHSIVSKTWDKFTYLYKVNNYNIHVQATLGVGNARRGKIVIVKG